MSNGQHDSLPHKMGRWDPICFCDTCPPKPITRSVTGVKGRLLGPVVNILHRLLVDGLIHLHICAGKYVGTVCLTGKGTKLACVCSGRCLRQTKSKTHANIFRLSLLNKTWAQPAATLPEDSQNPQQGKADCNSKTDTARHCELAGNYNATSSRCLLLLSNWPGYLNRNDNDPSVLLNV